MLTHPFLTRFFAEAACVIGEKLLDFIFSDTLCCVILIFILLSSEAIHDCAIGAKRCMVHFGPFLPLFILELDTLCFRRYDPQHPLILKGFLVSHYCDISRIGVFEWSERSREWCEPSRDWSERSRDWSEPSRDWSEPSRDWNERSRDWSEPSRDCSEPSRIEE